MTPRLPLLITKKDIEMSLLKISKSIACAITTLGLLSASLIAQAQTDLIPGQKITMVVGFPPGGGVDIAGRLVAERLTALIGRPVIVENRPGASSGVATKYVAASKPDGHIIFVNSNSMLANQLINPDAGYDVDKDLAPIGKFFTQSNILVAHPDFPANTLAELVALSNKQDVTFSSPGLGSIPHLAAERLLTLLANAKIRHIPYAGAAPCAQQRHGCASSICKRLSAHSSQHDQRRKTQRNSCHLCTTHECITQCTNGYRIRIQRFCRRNMGWFFCCSRHTQSHHQYL
ncbi:MAG: tripartite tricarboxylate transporter substrate binding protein [Betaproteobacteria bacterium]|nr:tripartite tricarboxylate transporter substrate binding protein [Betaproteobacteria bacterium]